MCSFRLCGSIAANPIIYRLVLSPPTYKIRQSLRQQRALDLCLHRVVYNNPSYSRILIGSRLWPIRWQMHDWRHPATKLFPLCFKMAESFENLNNRELKHRRFWATAVNRKFMSLLLARFHGRPLSYKALILAFTTWHFQRKESNTRRRGEMSTSGWRPCLKNVCA